jgi:hypothetical protein
MLSGSGQAHWDKHCRAYMAYKKACTVRVATCSLLCQRLSPTPGASASKWRCSFQQTLHEQSSCRTPLTLAITWDSPTLHPTGMCCVIFQPVECWIQDKYRTVSMLWSVLDVVRADSSCIVQVAFSSIFCTQEPLKAMWKENFRKRNVRIRAKENTWKGGKVQILCSMEFGNDF